MILVSACLLGLRTRYDGKRLEPNTTLMTWLREGKVIPVCPEQLGGLSTPRPPAEIVGGDGYGVLDGTAVVSTVDGEDVTPRYLRGAKETLCLACLAGAERAVLKEDSPACGVVRIYDGTFGHTTRHGPGVTAAYLQRAGLQVTNEEGI